jgi:hypothetical protein
MQLLVNENYPGEAVNALRQQGNNVVWVRGLTRNFTYLTEIRGEGDTPDHKTTINILQSTIKE